jgi:tRNA(adenine34) deaminase
MAIQEWGISTGSEDGRFLRLAIENSKKSVNTGNFPAGGVVVKKGQVVSSEISSPYPGLFHADAKAVSVAFKQTGILKEATLYVGMEPCLMCTSVAYWAGIRRIVYAIPKSRVSGNYYETHHNTHDVVSKFNEHMEIVHFKELESEALEIVRRWEESPHG